MADHPIWRKIEVRMWGDKKFRALSPLPPSGQALWFFLLTGPHTGPIPGLLKSGRAAMAEELGWQQEAFDKAFQEVFSLGMAIADWQARLVWIPNAIKCNLPQSPNVITSWTIPWQLLPECQLKLEAYTGLKSAIYSLGESFLKAFEKACPKPCVAPSSNQEADSRKQEQEKSSAAVASVVDAAELVDQATGMQDACLDTKRAMPTTQPNPTQPHQTKKLRIAHAPADWIPVDAWMGFVEMRKKMRGGLTERGVSLIVKELDNLRANGYDVGEVLDQSTRNNWKDVYPLKGHNPAEEAVALIERRKEQVRAVGRPCDAQFVGSLPEFPVCPLGECDGSKWFIDRATRQPTECRCARETGAADPNQRPAVRSA